MITKKTIFAAAAAAVMALPASGAFAQTAAATPDTAYTKQAPATSTDALNTAVDEKTMEEFAEVHPEVEKLNREYAEKIRAENDVEKRNKLAAEANKEIEDAIGDSDLSVQEYNRLSMLIQQDSNLQQQYHRALNK